MAKAEAIYRGSYEQTQWRFGPDDPRTANPLDQLGDNLLKQKKYKEAERTLRHCLQVRQAKQADEWNTFNTRSTLGEALLGQKKMPRPSHCCFKATRGCNSARTRFRRRFGRHV